MPSSDDVRGMQDILNKLANATDQTSTTPVTNKPVATSNVSSDAKAMYEILQKLDEATTNATKKVITEEDTDSSMLTAVALKENDNITINGNYNVEIVQKYVIDGVKKKYYNVKDADGNVLYEDVALFESAMGIVKHLMFDKAPHKVDEIARLDERYAGYLTEAAMYKQKSMGITETYKTDVFVAKQGNAIQKMANCKKQIKSLL
jgi:hypothetical protein